MREYMPVSNAGTQHAEVAALERERLRLSARAKSMPKCMPERTRVEHELETVEARLGALTVNADVQGDDVFVENKDLGPLMKVLNRLRAESRALDEQIKQFEKDLGISDTDTRATNSAPGTREYAAPTPYWE